MPEPPVGRLAALRHDGAPRIARCAADHFRARPRMSRRKTFTNPDTILAVAGRDPEANFGIVNPPVYHASTVTFPTVAALEKGAGNPFEGVRYGRAGTPTQFALEDAMAQIEGAYRAVATPSGLAAITAALIGFVKTGDHILVTDNAYGPVRRFCNDVLTRFGVETTYYDPMIGAGIARLIRPNTKVVWVESPGSVTFEVQDIPAISAEAHKAGAVVIMDNTWATPIFFRPYDKGVDVVAHAATKYVVGHSDAMMGLVTCKTRELFETVKGAANGFGYHAAPDDCYLALRGLRTMAVRLRHHEKSALNVAHWLKTRPEVDAVLHPALPDCPGHAIWKRDFAGSSGLFSIVLKSGYSKAAVDAMLDGMSIFAMGYSWGGYESLMIRQKPETMRTAVPWPAEKTCLRLHIGLEDVRDLIDDLEAGLDRLGGSLAKAAE
jgi:cystathionine beta-lyase